MPPLVSAPASPGELLAGYCQALKLTSMPPSLLFKCFVIDKSPLFFFCLFVSEHFLCIIYFMWQCTDSQLQGIRRFREFTEQTL